MSGEPDYMEASRHAAEIARWAMFRQGLKHDSSFLSTELYQHLASCASALGYRVIQASAEIGSDD